MSKFYITTPIYYVNDKPHIGHTYSTVVADALARFHRLKGDAVWFLTGTDENSQKNVQAMEKEGETNLSSYLERMSNVWRETWKDLDISTDDFIRTTEPRHLVGVERFWKAVQASGDIELKEYEAWYCVGCESFKTETEIVNGVCPLHPNKALERLQEKNYFFKLSKYREELLQLIDRGEFAMPEARRHEIRNYISDHLADISISREAKKLSVGIPVPGDDSQRIYVWFDALLNYMTAVGYGSDEERFTQWWPAELHLVGKDIIKFHCALWPAMIMSAAKHDTWLQDAAGQPLLPQQVYAHGFFTIEGQKISKSLGNAIDPRDLVPKYGFDAIRYFLLREITFGEDGDFSETRLRERYETDLGNTFGNLVQRVVAMSRKYFDGKVPPSDKEEKRTCWSGSAGLKELVEHVVHGYENSRCDLVLDSLWSGKKLPAKIGDRLYHGGEEGFWGLYQANGFIEETKPFKAENEAIRASVLYTLLEACRWYAWLLYPVMPATAEKVWTQLGLNAKDELSKGWDKALEWGQLESGTVLPEPQPLFPRLEAIV